jgi:ribosomal protein S18 acetylase RimI-like enzyme
MISMVAVKIIAWKEADSEKLAKFTVDCYRTREGSERVEYTIDMAKTMMDQFDDEKSRLFIAYRSGSLAGWMEVYDYTSSMNYIYSNHPIVLPGPHEDTIADELIRKAVEYTEKTGKGRLEIFFGGITESNRLKVDRYRRWYEAAGMKQGGEWAHMTAQLDMMDIPDIVFPDDIRVGKIRDVTNDELYPCYYRTFITSGDDRFLDQTEAQRRENFDDFFRRDRPQDEDASILLFHGEEIVGFAQVIVLEDGKGFYNGIGIHPDYRGRGLGTKMLTLSMKRAKMNGMAKITLEVDTTNEVAIGLYKRVGFIQDSGNVSFVWKKGSTDQSE